MAILSTAPTQNGNSDYSHEYLVENGLALDSEGNVVQLGTNLASSVYASTLASYQAANPGSTSGIGLLLAQTNASVQAQAAQAAVALVPQKPTFTQHIEEQTRFGIPLWAVVALLVVIALAIER